MARVQEIRMLDFKRFTDLTITDIPVETKLVVLVGPNGSGKSSLFEGFNFWQRAMRTGSFLADYHAKVGSFNLPRSYQEQFNKITFKFHDESPNVYDDSEEALKLFYVRTAYRNEAQFSLSNIGPVESAFDERKNPSLIINNESKVSGNYKRMVGEAVRELYNTNNDSMTKFEIRERQLSIIRESMRNVFEDLTLESLGNPFSDGTFLFKKGMSVEYKYINLSAGEKAAFDLILDFVIKRDFYNNTVYCVDEPETHMSTRIQAALLRELYKLVPENCQLWIATHSIGMMREALILYKEFPEKVVFLDFGDKDFDSQVILKPERINKQFWKKTFAVALDDLAELVAPSQIVFCEGAPISKPTGKNMEFDAKIYRIIFGETYPDVAFISLGGNNQVETDSIKLTMALNQILDSIKTFSLYDLDDRSPIEVEHLKKQDSRVLGRRDIENYLWDDEVIEKLCVTSGRIECVNGFLQKKSELLQKITLEGKTDDDVKSISGSLFVHVKNELKLKQAGNTKEAFCEFTLAPLDLLRKSGGLGAGKVTEGGDELNPKGKATPPMSVDALEHPKDLHATDDVFDSLAGIGQHPVFSTLLFGQRLGLGRLMRGDGVPVASPQTLIPRIPDQGRVMRKPYPRLPKQLEIMDGSSTRRRAQDVLSHGTDQDLELQGVPLLLAAVPAALLFLGRSHGTSDASTATML